MRTMAPLQQQILTSPIQIARAKTHTDRSLDRQCTVCLSDPDDLWTRRTEENGDKPPHVNTEPFLDMTLQDKLTTAAATGNTADVEDLLRAGAQVNGVNCFGRTALQVMMMGSSPVARVLLKHGAVPNVRDGSTGATPLHDAARAGFVDTVRLLVQFRADPRARDNMNDQPIDLARENGHVDVVDFLQSL